MIWLMVASLWLAFALTLIHFWSAMLTWKRRYLRLRATCRIFLHEMEKHPGRSWESERWDEFDQAIKDSGPRSLN